MSATIESTTNELKEDFLEVDQKIPGQNYVCLSFVSPEKILKNKEVFFVKKFLHHLLTNKEQAVSDIRQKMVNNELDMSYDKIQTLYDDWKYTVNELIEAEFFELNEFQTTMRAIKIRGTYDSYKEASVRAQILRKKDASFDVFVGQVGYWLPFDPASESIKDQEYQENQLNELVKKYKENASNKDDLYEQVKNEKIEKARKEVEAKKAAFKAQQAQQSEDDQTKEGGPTDPVTEHVEGEHEKNIEKLRSIVDESDKLYYDNLKNNKTEEELQEETKEAREVVSNFASETMQQLGGSDPWLQSRET
jgi:hypothetical protein